MIVTSFYSDSFNIEELLLFLIKSFPYFGINHGTEKKELFLNIDRIIPKISYCHFFPSLIVSVILKFLLVITDKNSINSSKYHFFLLLDGDGHQEYFSLVYIATGTVDKQIFQS